MSATHVKPPNKVSQELQEMLRTNRGWQHGVSDTYARILEDTRPTLQWPYRTPPLDFIAREITRDPDSKFLKLPPILYVVSFQCSVAVKYIRYMVNVLGVNINSEYAIENEKKPGESVGLTTPLGWFLYVTRWNHGNDYYVHAPMLYELLRLGADPNAPAMTNFKRLQKNSPLYAALVDHNDHTMFFAKQLIGFGAAFSAVCDNAPLVAAMRRIPCTDVIDLFEDNIAALGGTQNENAFDNAGYTAMHYFIWSSLRPYFAASDSLRSVKHYVKVLHKTLHVSTRNTDSVGQLPSDIVKNAMKNIEPTTYTADDMQDLLAYVSDLEKHEPRFMTSAAGIATSTLPPELARLVLQRVMLNDSRFAIRLAPPQGGGS